MNNGLVAAIVSEEDIEKLLSAVEQTGRAEVDLEQQTIKSGNYVVPFSIDPARKTRLLNGWDELDLTAQYKDRIEAFAAKDRAERPWAVPRVIASLSARPPRKRGPGSSDEAAGCPLLARA